MATPSNSSTSGVDKRQVSFDVGRIDAIRDGPANPSGGRARFRTPAASLGVLAVDLDHALQFAADLEDEGFVSTQRSRS
jgi:hypothetical protein